MLKSVEFAASVVTSQTQRIRRRLRKNRSRMIYQVESDEKGIIARVYSRRRAIALLMKNPGSWFTPGKQNANFITAGNLNGIHWNIKQQRVLRKS